MLADASVLAQTVRLGFAETVALFYEREGGSTDGIETLEPMLGIDLVTYTRRV